jgi:cytochrome c-type biogenesis protein
MSFDPSVIQSASPLVYLIVFLGGVVTSIGPCNVAMVPLIVGYVGRSRNLSRGRSFVIAFTFAVGLAVTFMWLGVAAALVGGIIGGTSRALFYVAAAVCLVAGLSMLSVVKLPLPQWFADLRERAGAVVTGIPGALILGLLSGFVASQCATPVLAAILTYVMTQSSALIYGATLLFVYALGRGVPIVLAGTFTGALKRLQSLEHWSLAIERVSGAVILAVGLYFVWIA